MAAFKRKTDRIQSVAWPIIKQVQENQGALYERIMVPITDGKRMYNIPCNLKEAYDSEAKSGGEAVRESHHAPHHRRLLEGEPPPARRTEHSVQNASYEQKDPLLIFKLESVKLFDNMVDDMNNRITSILTRGQIPEMEQQEVREAAPEQHSTAIQRAAEKTSADPAQQVQPLSTTRARGSSRNRQPVVKDKMPGRNDPCPCGSGKKFKNCHGGGCAYGGPTEFVYRGIIIDDSIEIAYPEHHLQYFYDKVPGLFDDIYMDLTFVNVFNRLGLDAPVDSFATAFAYARYPLWHANQAGRYNIQHGIIAAVAQYAGDTCRRHYNRSALTADPIRRCAAEHSFASITPTSLNNTMNHKDDGSGGIHQRCARQVFRAERDQSYSGASKTNSRESWNHFAR